MPGRRCTGGYEFGFHGGVRRWPRRLPPLPRRGSGRRTTPCSPQPPGSAQRTLGGGDGVRPGPPVRPPGRCPSGDRHLVDRPYPYPDDDTAQSDQPHRALVRRWGRATVVNLGLVVPRYGEKVVGGTEHWLRMLCEHLVAMKGWRVEVFTTCATSAASWDDELAPGDSVLGGVTVHRHRAGGRVQ